MTERRSLLAVFAHPDLVTTHVDVSAYLETKQKAIACHRTQLSADSPFQKIPPHLMLEFQRTEHFILARGHLPIPDGIETDLFHGVD